VYFACILPNCPLFSLPGNWVRRAASGSSHPWNPSGGSEATWALSSGKSVSKPDRVPGSTRAPRLRTPPVAADPADVRSRPPRHRAPMYGCRAPTSSRCVRRNRGSGWRWREPGEGQACLGPRGPGVGRHDLSLPTAARGAGCLRGGLEERPSAGPVTQGCFSNLPHLFRLPFSCSLSVRF
jgi:hypothetical protein